MDHCATQDNLTSRRGGYLPPGPRLLVLLGSAHVGDNKTIAERPRHRFRLRHPQGSKWSVDLSTAQGKHLSESRLILTGAVTLSCLCLGRRV